MHHVTVLALMALILAASPARAVQIDRTGAAGDDVKITTLAICLAGGGSDDAWAAGWRYMLERSGGGDIVIVRADGSRGGYESWIFNDEGAHGFPRVHSVTTISLTKAGDANLAGVESAIREAELVFFAGGDQTKYIDWFRGSRLAAAVEYLMKVKKVPIGGTSAGMALLAGIDFRAKYDSPAEKDAMVTSLDVMKDPTGVFVDLDRTVLAAPFMKGVITDTHFSQRGREGRLVGFMARAVSNRYAGVAAADIKAIAADEGTVVCYDASGQARVFGAGSAFFLKGGAPIERIRSGRSLHWYAEGRAVRAYVIRGSDDGPARFDLRAWSGSGGTSEFWFVNGADEEAPVFGRR